MSQLLFYDFEYITILIILIFIFIHGLKKRNQPLQTLKLDKSFSNALKGIGCILILISHFYNMYYWQSNSNISWLHLSKLCGNFSANAALVIFMFISGYGLTISHSKKEPFIYFCRSRLWKVYKPLLIVCIISFIIYTLLPNSFSIEQLTYHRITDIVHKSHYIFQYPTDIILFSIGYLDWYVYCIAIFYIIYWLSVRFTNKTNKRSFLLLILMIIYYIIAYTYIGKEQAHFYRFPWAFLAGHFVANIQQYTTKQKLCLGFIYTIFTGITIYNEDIIQVLGWIIAICILILAFLLNNNYYIEGKNITTLGNISYYVYLTHTRIAFIFILYIGLNSLIIAIILSIIISAILYKIENRKLLYIFK